MVGEGNGTPLQHSCLENPIDWGAWWAAVHGVAKSRTRLSDSTFTFHFHALEKEMATQSSVLAWRIPGTGEPRELPSMGSHRVRHNWSNLAAAAHARRVMLKILQARLQQHMNRELVSRSWWWTGRPGVLGFMGLQRVGHNWATELNWTDWRSSPKS